LSLEADLAAEIEKWSKKLDNSLQNVQPSGEKGTKMLRNIKAYRNDSGHFLERGDFIKSFECLIWAWAILELGRELNFFEANLPRDAR
jgi:hypothetical protein